MALNIRNPETDKLAETLAQLTGETKTAAVTKALPGPVAVSYESAPSAVLWQDEAWLEPRSQSAQAR